MSFATVEAWALANGLDADMQSMTQAEKTMLRYQFVLANTGAASGDFLRTINSWHNQLVLLTGAFQQLGSIVGGVLINAFKPFVQALNSVMGAVINFAQVVSDALGAIFGWEYQVGGGVANDYEAAAGAAEDLEDATGGAAKKAKELNRYIAPWHEVNNMTSNDGGSGGGGGGGAGGGGAAGGNADGGEWIQKESLWEKYTSEIDSLYELGKYISGVLTDAMNDIDWDRVYESARGFGTGLANFLNGLISPELFGATGQTIAGALNSAIYAALSFGETFNWKNFGNSIAAGVNEFFSNFDFKSLAGTLNTFANGILDSVITAIDKTDWDKIGSKIGTFLESINFVEIGGKVGQAIWKAINAGFDLYVGMFKVAPLETALLTIVGAVKKFEKLKSASRLLETFGDKIGNLAKILPTLTGALQGNQGAVVTLSGMYPKLSSVVQKVSAEFGKFVTAIKSGDIVSAAKTGFGGLNTAITNIRNNLSGVQKLALTAVSGFAGFSIASDALSNIASGTGNLAANLAELATGAAIAATGIYTAFGPTGIIVAAITGVIALLGSLHAELSKNPELDAWVAEFDSSQKDINSRIESIRTSLSNMKTDFGDTGLAQAKMAEDMATKYDELHKKANPTAEDIALMKQYSADLVQMYPELEKYFNDETGLLEANREELQKTIEKQLELAKTKAAMSGLESAYEQQIAAEKALRDAEADHAESTEKLNLAYEKLREVDSSSFYSGLSADHNKAAEAVRTMREEVETSEQTLNEAKEAYNSASENVEYFATAYEESAASVGTSTEEISQDLQSASSSFAGVENEVIETANNISTNGSQVIEAAKQVFSSFGIEIPNSIIASFESKMPEVLESTQNMLSQINQGYSLNAESLVLLFGNLGLQIPDELISSLAGEEANVQKQAINLLMQLTEASDSERGKIIEAFLALGLDADQSLINGLADGTLLAQVKTSAENLPKTAQSSAEGASKDSSGSSVFKKIGLFSLQGFIDGLSDSSLLKKVANVAAGIFNTARRAIEDAGGIESPSKVTREDGRYTIQGYNLGLQDEMDSTYSLVDSWANGVMSEFKGRVIAADFSVDTSKFNYTQPKLDPVQVTSDVQEAIDYAFTAGGIIDYNRLGNAVYQAQTQAMKENPVKIGDKDIFTAAQRQQRREYRRTFKTGWAGID